MCECVFACMHVFLMCLDECVITNGHLKGVIDTFMSIDIKKSIPLLSDFFLLFAVPSYVDSLSLLFPHSRRQCSAHGEIHQTNSKESI